MKEMDRDSVVQGSIWKRRFLEHNRDKEIVRKVLVALLSSIMTFLGWSIYNYIRQHTGHYPIQSHIIDYIFESLPFVAKGMIFFLFFYFFPYWFLLRREFWKSLKIFGQCILVCVFGTALVLSAPGILTPVTLSCAGKDPFESCGPIKAWFVSEKRAFKGLSDQEMNYPVKMFHPFRRVGAFYIERDAFKERSMDDLNKIYEQVVTILKETGNYEWFKKAGVKIALIDSYSCSFFNLDRNIIGIKIYKPRQIAYLLTRIEKKPYTPENEKQKFEELIRRNTLHEAGHAYFHHYLCPEAMAKGLVKNCNLLLNKEKIDTPLNISSEVYALRFEEAGKPFCTLEECAWIFKPIEEINRENKDLAQEIMRDTWILRIQAFEFNRKCPRYHLRKATNWELLILSLIGLENQTEPQNYPCE